MQNKYQSPWFVEALQSEGELKINKLKTNLTTDICIVGGGYTGLWTALKIKEKNSSIDVTIIEKDLCGSGASGRNGGCMIPQSTKFTAMKNTIGIKDAKKMVNATEDAVYNIRDYCLQNNIDAKIRLDGVVYGATNKSHKGAFENLVEDLKKNQINSWKRLSKEKIQTLTGSKKMIDGYYSPVGGSLQPALLIRGLKKTAENKGIKIFEQSAVLSFKDKDNIVVKTKNGSVACQKLIFAINAWTPTFLPFLSRSVILVSSDMIISEPIKNKLEDLVLQNYETEWKNYDAIIGEPISIGGTKIIKVIKYGKLAILRNPKAIFSKSGRTIRWQFDMFHGSGNLDKAIELLPNKDRDDFRHFTRNETSFSRGNMFISKSPKIINLYFRDVFDWLKSCEVYLVLI